METACRFIKSDFYSGQLFPSEYIHKWCRYLINLDVKFVILSIGTLFELNSEKFLLLD